MENEFVKAFSDSFAMKGGEGPHSYAQNSNLQRVGIEAAKSLIQSAIANKFDPKTISAASKKPICIADLGCSTGPNTFIAVQFIVEAIELQYQSHGLAVPELQVFFNDQVSNDFNTLFKNLPSNRKYFAAGVPGSFYGRLFPMESLYFVHSSASLNWISKVPKVITDRTSTAWNKGRIHYTNAPKEVVDAYASQYQKDMETFLRARAQELVGNGLMALQIPVANDVIFNGKDLELLGDCLLDMAKEGKINEEKVDTFNLPIYFSPRKDLMKILESNEDFSIEQMEIMDAVLEIEVPSSASLHRAALEGLIENHFGDGIVDELFDRHAKKLMEFKEIMDIQKRKIVGLFVLLKRKLQCEWKDS
ncbi:loganic acid O-methyltransferase-like [Gastrolobium bilobum]|uniref:loganic acid O-methyltransferase-like n=1 Tax=Gastrolobium bilobum TaxID=150636 RepID=UPI002AB17941|nr:loganic acid O-methyltransferase-like [Gastrolobium bilobum]